MNDVILVGYQNLHLLGRLQRRLVIGPRRPGSPQIDRQTLHDLFELSRSMLADTHRTRVALASPKPAEAPSGVDAVSLADLYVSMREIHDQLLAMTRSQPL